MGEEQTKKPDGHEHGGKGSTTTPADKHLPENSKDSLDEKLDLAMDETFPGSDPISVKITK